MKDMKTGLLFSKPKAHPEGHEGKNIQLMKDMESGLLFSKPKAHPEGHEGKNIQLMKDMKDFLLAAKPSIPKSRRRCSSCTEIGLHPLRRLACRLHSRGLRMRDPL